MKKLQFIDIGKPFRIIGKICKDIERAFRFKGINVNFIVMMIDYIGFAFILKWNLQTGCATLQDGLDAVNSGLESANNTLSSVLGKSKTTDNNEDAVVVNKSKSNKVNVDDLPSDYTIDLTKNPNKLAAIFNDVRRNQNEEKYEGKVITLTAKIESMEIGASVEFTTCNQEVHFVYEATKGDLFSDSVIFLDFGDEYKKWKKGDVVTVKGYIGLMDHEAMMSLTIIKSK